MTLRILFIVALLGVFSGRADTTNTYAASGSETNLPIPTVGTGQSGTTNDLTISQITVTNLAPSQTIIDLNVTIDVLHTFDEDLVIRLIGPDGTSSLLATNRGGANDNYSVTTFDDQAAQPISAGNAPFNGSFRPEEPLTNFVGKAGAGTWRLQIEDTSGGDTGTLQGWSLQMVVNDVNVSPPALAIALSDTNAVISWPVSASGFGLESKMDLTISTWTPVQPQPVIVGSNYSVTLPATGPSQFFRLRK